MGCQGSKNSNSEVLLTKTDESSNSKVIVRGTLIDNLSEANNSFNENIKQITQRQDKNISHLKKQTTPDQDSERLCMWCIVSLEDDIVNKLYKDNWCLGSECQSMNEKNESKNYCFLYKYKTDHQIIEKQFLSLEEDLERNYQWLSKSIFIQHHNLDIINLQKEGWILGNHSKNYKFDLTKECFYYLFKKKNL